MPASDDNNILVQKAVQALSSGDFGSAKKYVDAVLRAAPKHTDALWLLAQICADRGEMESAVATLKGLIKSRPKEARFREFLIECLIFSQQLDEAVVAARAAVNAFPKNDGFMLHLGHALGLKGENQKAIKIIKKFTAKHATHAPALAMLGVLHSLEGEPAAALDALYRAHAAQPDNIKILYDLASVHISRHEYLLAEKNLQKLIALNPDHIPALRKISEIRVRTSDYAGAVTPLRKVLQAAPDDLEVLGDFAMAAAIGGDPGEAMQTVEGCIAKFPDAVKLLQPLAFAQFRAKQLDQVVQTCDDILKTDLLPTVALAYKSAALNEMGRREEAAEILALDSLVEVIVPPPPTGWDDLDTFNESIAQYIFAHASLDYHPTNRSLRKGRDTLELFDGAESGSALGLKELIGSAVEDYIDTLAAHPPHDFIDARPDAFKLESWANVFDEEGRHLPHFHPPAWLSGVFYPSLPTSMLDADIENPEGALELERAYYRLSVDDDPPVRLVKPAEGTLILFPSFIGHQTIPVSVFDKPRVSIAFNIVPD